jgi:hypothetical protein
LGITGRRLMHRRLPVACPRPTVGPSQPCRSPIPVPRGPYPRMVIRLWASRLRCAQRYPQARASPCPCLRGISHLSVCCPGLRKYKMGNHRPRIRASAASRQGPWPSVLYCTREACAVSTSAGRGNCPSVPMAERRCPSPSAFLRCG